MGGQRRRRRASPLPRLTLLASPSGAALAPHLPMVDDVIAWDAPWVKRPAAAAGDDGALGADELRLIERLAADGGEIHMPFELAPWGEHYGQVIDKYGLLWHFNVV